MAVPGPGTSSVAPSPLPPDVPAERPAWLRYGAALAGTAVALALSLAFRSFIAPNVFIFFFAAIILCAWFGGRGPALVVTLLAIPLVNYFFLEQPFTWAAGPVTLLRLAVFAGLAVLIGSMRESLDASRRRAVQSARDATEHAQRLEEQAVELQQQAAELELQTEEAQTLAEELAEANRQLEESAARSLAEAQALAHVGSWEWDVTRDHVWWSDEMYRIYGFEPGSVQVSLGTFLAHVHPDDRERVRAGVERSRETREPFELDHRIVLSDGSVRTLHARGRVETDRGGTVTRMSGTGQDVTDARAAEETARRLAAEQAGRAEAEAGRGRLEAVLEGIGEAFIAFDSRLRYTYVNRRSEEMLGRPRAELLGRSVDEVFPEVVSPSWAVLHRVARERRPEQVEFLSPMLGRWISMRVSPWNGGVSVFYEDVTDRRRALEERSRLAAIVESSEDAIFSKTLEGIVQTWNAGAERLYGYTAAEMVGRSVATLAPPDRVDEIPAILERLARGERLSSFETVRVRKDGTPIDVLLAISPLHDADGRVVGASTIARDVSERRRADAALRASEARYRRLIDTAEEGIWLLDREGRTTYVNERMAGMLGRPAAEVEGRPLTEFVHPSARAEVAEHLARLDGARERHDVRLVRADGSDLWALVSLSSVRGEAGEWQGTLAMVTDVTDRRRAEESVRFLAEASRLLSQSLDYERVLGTIAGLAVPRLADWCAVVLAAPGGGVRVEAAHADPERLPLVRELVAVRLGAVGPGGPVSTALRQGRSVLIEDHAAGVLRGAVPDPRYDALLDALAPASLVAVPMALEGTPLGAIVLASSYAARRFGPGDRALAEELARRAATAVENARLHQAEHEARRQAEDAVAQIARLQAVTAALSTARTMEEVARAALGESMRALGAAAGWISQLAPGSDRVELVWATGFDAAVMAEFRSIPLDTPIPLSDAVRTGEIIAIPGRAELETMYPGIPDRGQRSRYAAWAVAPMWVEGRAVGGMVLNFMEPRGFDADTLDYLLAVGRQGAVALERARLFEAEHAARAEAEAANRAKFDFLTTMSHELRTPLNAIAGYVDLLELGIRGPLTDAQRDDLRRIRRSQTHLLGLINDVLNFARIETGHVHFDLADVALDELLGEIETLIAPQVQARGLFYEYRRLDPAATVRADPEKLRQIVLNLLSNAVKFTPEGGRITLSSEVDGAWARVRVADTGIGIPGDKLGTIFEPFVQVATGYTRTSEGTGLGLSISRDLARAMGGDLGAESREGEGSVFTLTLPLGASSID